ncbi:MAG: DUF2934 domain-containing protein [Opitutaceae bacterium]|nr:DUF2934 domain-containing protein [Opitutaceae bacterium]
MNTKEETPVRPARMTNTAGENAAGTPNLRTRPLHEEISERARDLWQRYGQPEGRDEEIWLEAERQLLGADSLVNNADGAVSAKQLEGAAPMQTSTPEGGERRDRGNEAGLSRMQSSTLEPAGKGRSPRRK